MITLTPNSGVVSGDRYLGPHVLAVNANKAASAMHSVGVWQGDVVVLLLRNDFAYFEATLAATSLGATTVPMNWHMSPEEIAYVLDDCDAKMVIAHADLLSESVLAVCSGREVLAVETPVEIKNAYGLSDEICQVPGAVPEWLSWINAFPEWDKDAINLSAPMFYTSGTTGMPKGVKRSPVAPEVAAKAIRRTGLAFGLPGTPVKSIMTGPLYHSAPNAYGMKVVRDGGLLVLQPRFDDEDTLALIQQYKISHLHMVPTMFVHLLKLDDNIRSAYDLSSLEHVAHGAAPCSAEVKKSMIKWWGEVIHEYYAMTETGVITICNSRQWLDHQGTVGTPLEGIEIKIVDEQGETCAVNTPGEICISSETTPFVAYHRAAQKTADMRRGYFVATGDVGYLDDDNFLYISDRISDMVISGGVNIYPAEIEKVLIGMPGVKDCAIFGSPDPDFGERLVAAIESTGDLTDKDVISYLKEHMASYKVPRAIVFTNNLPREDSGKIKKRILKKAFNAGEPI